MPHYKLGLVIGRFQPFHNGHRYLILEALESIDKLVINIGSANIVNESNPFTLEQRKNMIEEFIKQEKIEDRILKIVPTDDIPDNDEWAVNTLRDCGKVDVIVSNNDSGVNVFFERMGQEIFRIPYYKRYLLEGTKIRKLMKEGKPWQDRVPEYLIAQIKTVSI